MLTSLCEQPSEWQHGYALARQTGLKSGTLYPILIRLADRRLVEACWQEEPMPGLPRPAHVPAHSRRARRGHRGCGRGGHGQGASGCDPATGARGRGASGAMSRLSRAAATAGRVAVRLVPAARRDWAEAVWAEAYEVPAGWQRLAWQAGGVRLIAKEAKMVRRTGILLLFAVAAGAAAWGAWPGSRVSHGAAVQGGIIITVCCWSACRC